MPQNFQLLDLPIVQCGMVDGLGNPIAQSITPGATIKHWADLQLAARWFRYARSLARDQAALRAAASGDLSVAYRYLSGIATAIMNGYNALNIPWMVDPVARELWRRFLAGPPKSINGNALRTDFGLSENYNDAWYHPPAGLFSQSGMPYGLTFRGEIPAVSRIIFDRTYQRPRFAATHPLQLRLPFAPEVVDPIDPTWARAPDAERAARLAIATDWANAWPSAPMPGWPRAERCVDATSMAACEQPPWNQLWFDAAAELFGEELNPSVPLTISPPIGLFYPWLLEWAESVASRSPATIAVCARAYATWRNIESVNSMPGGIEQFLREASSAGGDVVRQLREPSPVASTVAAAVSAIGLAAAPATAGISGLVGGAVSAVIMIANASGSFSGASIRDRGRDDLGRYKPVFERAWLSGDPSRADAGGRPRLEIPEVPGSAPQNMLIPNDSANLGGLRGIPVDQVAITSGEASQAGRVAGYTSGTYTPPPPLPPVHVEETAASGLPMPAKIVIGAALAYGAYRLFANR